MDTLKQKKLLWLFICFLSLFVCQTVYGKADLTVLRQKNLDVQPLDVASSEDGSMIFILSLGELIIYSSKNDRIINRSAIDNTFDRITYSEKNKTLILTGRSSKSLKIIHVEEIHDISLSGLPFRGPFDAPVTLAVFDDYQWPYCARLEPVFRQLSDRYKDRLKLVIKHFPLPNHKFARKASQASLAAHKQGKFWEFHTKLFENYDAINDDKIEEIAMELKLDIDKFHADINLPDIQQIINRDIQNGKKIGVAGTPTIFINGKQINPRTFDDFIKKIESELKKNKTD